MPSAHGHQSCTSTTVVHSPHTWRGLDPRILHYCKIIYPMIFTFCRLYWSLLWITWSTFLRILTYFLQKFSPPKFKAELPLDLVGVLKHLKDRKPTLMILWSTHVDFSNRSRTGWFHAWFYLYLPQSTLNSVIILPMAKNNDPSKFCV